MALPFVGLALERAGDQLARLVDLALLRVGERREDVLPRGRLEDDARLRSDGEERCAVLGRDRAALRPRPCEDERSGRRVDLVVAERERRPAAQDDVHLLVAVLLVVLLDHALARLRRVRVGAERGDPEPPAHRPPDELAVVDRQLLQLVHVRDLVALAHPASLSASSTTGSIRSIPSTRSSRFSVPAQAAQRLGQFPVVAELGEPLGQLGRASSTASHSSRGVLPKSAWWIPYRRRSSSIGRAWSSTRRSTRTSDRRA